MVGSELVQETKDKARLIKGILKSFVDLKQKEIEYVMGPTSKP